MFNQKFLHCSIIILSLIANEILTQMTMELYLVEECNNNTVVADLPSRFASLSFVNGFFRLLDQSKLFYIEKSHGKLRTKHRVDRESICPKIDSFSDCTFTLLILYQSNKMITKPVMIKSIIHILDINDHAPTWNRPKNQITLQIPEHSQINSAFRLPEAIDLDRGPDNITKAYTISKTKDGQMKFDIRLIKNKQVSKFGNELSLIILGDLDRENQSHYQVVITAYDGGSPPLSGELKVNIDITDINDHPPRFKNTSPVKLELLESTLIYKKIIVFEAEDVDSSDVNNLRFTFVSTTDEDIIQTFWLKDKNGELVLQKPLNYETKMSYSFSVQVSDGKFHSTIDVEIKVLNVNDNAPKISIQSFNGMDQLAVPENSEIGQHIGAVLVTDADDKTGLLPVNCEINNPIVELSALYDGAKNKFVLKTTKVFDREVRSYHVFTITCSDTGEPVKKSSVSSRLHIIDVNDNPPVFLNTPMKASIKENMSIGTLIYQLRVHDEDTDVNANFRFYLQSGSDLNFRIDSENGQIFSKVLFNAEEESKYEILVYVTDRADGSSSKVPGSIELTIEDVNDNPPTFDKDIYHFQILENVKSGTLIGKVEAKDIDISEIHRTIKYNFKQPTDLEIQKHISITHHGKIYVRSSQLDREENSSFTFYVIATDNGNPILTTSAYVQIEVKDINDNSPEWVYPDSLSNNINITFHLPVGHEITKFVAKDIDQGLNGELEYFIAQMIYGNGIFQLQSSTGVLYVARTLTVQDVRSYRMVIGVRDHGIPSLSKLRTFKINIVHQLDESKGFALFGKFEGDLLIILVLVIVTLIICLGLISVIWFLKCGSRPSGWCHTGAFNLREHLRPPDGHSPSPSHEIIPVYMDRRQDSFISNLTRTTCSEKMKILDSERDGSQFHLSPNQTLYLNNKNLKNNYQCLQHVKGFDRSLLNHNNCISHNCTNTTIRRSPNFQTTSSTPTNCYESQSDTICKAHTLPKDISVPSSNSQLSVRWLDKQCQQNDDEEYQICISNRSTPKLPIIKVTRSSSLNQNNAQSNNLKDTEYTQLSSTTTFLGENNDSSLPSSYV